MSVWKCEAVPPSLLGWVFSQQNDLPPSLKDCFSLCQTHCCLIVTGSDSSLLLALRQSERSQSLCAGDIKACLSERRIGKGGGGVC